MERNTVAPGKLSSLTAHLHKLKDRAGRSQKKRLICAILQPVSRSMVTRCIKVVDSMGLQN